MANAAHVAKLNEGLASWNAWRDKHPGLRIDLHAADLQGLAIDGDGGIGADLRGVDLRCTNLRCAKMHGADLAGAKLEAADLRRANLASARLTGANAAGADLSDAVLSDADLRDADLTGADLTRTFLFQGRLSSANLTRAKLDGTILLNADLTDVKLGATTLANLDLSGTHGLPSIVHLLPSEVGCGTLWKSRGNLPEAFLRGAGVPSRLVERLHESPKSKDDPAFAFHFISCSDADGEFSVRLQARLAREGIPSWVVPESLKRGSTGEISEDRVHELSGLYDKLLLVISGESLETEWLSWEIHRARWREHYEFRRLLFPIRIVAADRIEKDDSLGGVLCPEYLVHDFSGWEYELSEPACRQLLDDLRTDALRASFEEPTGPP